MHLSQLKIKLYKTSIPFVLLLAIMSPSIAIGEHKDTVKNNVLHFELSFGQSLLFISNSDVVNIRNNSNIVMPTSSLLFFAEFRFDKRFRYPIFFNLPTESKQFLVNNQLVSEKASPTIGAGVQSKLFKIKVDSKSRLDAEAGPLLSLVLDKSNYLLVPIIAGRIKIVRGESFIMYVGMSYTFGVNTMGMFYGTGSTF